MELLRRRKGAHPRTGSGPTVARQAGGLFRHVQTTGSLVVRLTPKRWDAFFTGTSGPGLSTFKPVHLDQTLEDDLQGADLSRYHDRSLWWRHEQFYRRMLLFPRPDPAYGEQRDELEKNMLIDILSHRGGELTKVRGQLQRHLLDWETGWAEKVSARKPPLIALRPSTYYWKRQSRLAGLKL